MKKRTVIVCLSLIVYSICYSQKNFKVYPIADVFCQDACKLVNDEGNPLYFDNGHLTLSGSEMLRGVFEGVLADVGK